MDFFRVGIFLRPHGVKGELKLMPLTDDLKRFAHLSNAFVEVSEGKHTPIRVFSARVTAVNSVLVTLEGVTSVQDAEALRGKYLCVDRENAVQLPEGTYFISDIIGCNVVTNIGEQLGEVVDVYQTAANDVYCIEGIRKLSVPALKKLLVEVDITQKRITLDAKVLLEVGLFEN